MSDDYMNSVRRTVIISSIIYSKEIIIDFDKDKDVIYDNIYELYAAAKLNTLFREHTKNNITKLLDDIKNDMENSDGFLYSMDSEVRSFFKELFFSVYRLYRYKSRKLKERLGDALIENSFNLNFSYIPSTPWEKYNKLNITLCYERDETDEEYNNRIKGTEPMIQDLTTDTLMDEFEEYLRLREKFRGIIEKSSEV